MNKNYEKLIRAAGEDVRLTPEMRERMRGAVMTHVRENPRARTGVPVPSPYVSQAAAIFAYVNRPWARALALLLIVVLSGGTLSYAAEGTLPGDTLYPLKVDVTEPVRTYLAATPFAKASWEMTLAARRIDEAATLAVDGRFASSTALTLTAAFESHARSALADAADERDPAARAALSATFATRLSAYDAVLAHVDARYGTTTDGTLRAAIAARAVSFADIASSTEGEGERAHAQADAAHLGARASAAIDDSANLIGNSRGQLDAASAASAESDLETATNLAAKGNELLNHHDTEGAQHAFQDSLSATARLDVLTHAAANLKIPAFSLATTSASTTTSAAPETRDGEQRARSASGNGGRSSAASSPEGASRDGTGEGRDLPNPGSGSGLPLNL
ncbi:MAG: hypothetical protein KGI41_00675 [Patescibacteria group bacterium]|nr:hypothetical protein [Patescibacteria group bacterium]MDE1965743.1 hypothetical protein [Patescibacteria group bacterium]